MIAVNTITVMLVDDHHLLLDLLEKVLSKYPDISVVEKVSTGEHALAYCSKHRPNIILQDIHLGAEDGFEITSQIRKTYPGTRSIGLSMFAQPAYAKKFFRAGGSGYVTKSSPMEELVEAIRIVRSGETYLCRQIREACNGEDIERAASSNAAALLSLREIEIIQMIREGDTSKEIAEKLFLAPKTVELHRSNILNKLNIKNTAALIAFAYKNCI